MSKIAKRIYLGLIFLFLYTPILILIVFSFNDSKSRTKFTGFTFDWYKELVNNDLIINSLINTLVVGVVAAVIATVLGTLASIGIINMKKWKRTAIMNVTYLPIINPEIVTGISLMMLFVYFNKFFGIELGFITVLISHITFCLPYVILNVLPRLRAVDKNTFEAAQDLGCNNLKAFFKVVLPQIMPGVISGFLMAFTFSLDDFVITYFTSGSSFQTLPVTIYSMTRKRVNPQINAISAILFFIVLTALLIINIKDLKFYKNRKGIPY